MDPHTHVRTIGPLFPRVARDTSLLRTVQVQAAACVWIAAVSRDVSFQAKAGRAPGGGGAQRAREAASSCSW